MAAVLKEVYVPDIGDYHDIEVIEVLVKPGDVIQAEDSLITLESDKAAMEVPSPVGGTVKSLKLKPGDRVSKGSLILVAELAEGSPDSPATDRPEPVPPAVPPESSAAAPAEPPVPASAPAGDPGQTASDREIRVPDIGDYHDIEVIEVLVKPGDVIQAEDSLITLESDKAAMEVPSPVGGTVKSLKLKPGDRVSKGSLILTLQADTATPVAAVQPPDAPSAPPASPASAAPASAPAPTPTAAAPASAPVASQGMVPHASPAIRKFARELGVTLDRVQGTGPKGRILREDVQQYVKESLRKPSQPVPVGGLPGLALPPLPEVDFARFGPVETLALSRIQKLSGPNLHRNWVSIPHITQHDEADITELEAFRVSLKAEAEQRGVKLSILPFAIKAVAASLKAFPTFNASLAANGESLVLKRYFHIGVAVDTPEGLVVPVVRDVDQKSVFDIALELAELSQKARGKKLRGPDLEGGCFTISSLGGIGGTAFTPIINAPEVAILGLSKSRMKPVYLNGQFVPRLLLPLSLSYDHRVIDGAQGARFVVHLSGLLGDMRRILL